MVRVTDKESFNTARRLSREEGLLAGGSAGTALAAALKYAQRLQRPKYIVVLLPDTGRNYINRIYSDQWMQENGFWEGARVQVVNISEILKQKKNTVPSLLAVSPHDKLIRAVSLMQEFNISQFPVIDHNDIVGSLNEASLMQLLHEGIEFDRQDIATVMGKPLPSLEETTDVSEAYRVLLSGATGIVVKKEGVPVGLIGRADLVTYWISQKREGPDEV